MWGVKCGVWGVRCGVWGVGCGVGEGEWEGEVEGEVEGGREGEGEEGREGERGTPLSISHLRASGHFPFRFTALPGPGDSL